MDHARLRAVFEEEKRFHTAWTSTGALRRQGFFRAMARHGLVGIVCEAHHYTRHGGAAAVAGLIGDRKITGVVAANDLIALGVFDALQAAGLTCPNDVSVVGHNDMPLMDVVSPPLTTIRIEHREMGRTAASILVENINSGSAEIRHIVLQPNLIVRKSTSAVNGATA